MTKIITHEQCNNKIMILQFNTSFYATTQTVDLTNTSFEECKKIIDNNSDCSITIYENDFKNLVAQKIWEFVLCTYSHSSILLSSSNRRFADPFFHSFRGRKGEKVVANLSNPIREFLGIEPSKIQYKPLPKGFVLIEKPNGGFSVARDFKETPERLPNGLYDF